jgi:AraC-like DNA-binding protein
MDTRIRILLKIIEERDGKLEMSSRQIGSMLGLGEARVLRLFSTEVGKPLRRHSLEVRMARATELLKNDQLPIKTIASNCGYTEVSNFYRDFKSVYGVSPKQMRHMHMITHLHNMRSQAASELRIDQ